MKVLVTGINGQLGHDVMLELSRRGHEAVGSGSSDSYRGTDEVSGMTYVPMNITDREAVSRVLNETQPDAVIHCAAWTAVDAAEDEETGIRWMQSITWEPLISQRQSGSWMQKCCIFPRIMFLTERETDHGNRMTGVMPR